MLKKKIKGQGNKELYLPEEMWIEIISFLEPSELLNFSLVSKGMKTMIEKENLDEVIWKRQCQNFLQGIAEFGLSRKYDKTFIYFQTYLKEFREMNNNYFLTYKSLFLWNNKASTYKLEIEENLKEEFIDSPVYNVGDVIKTGDYRMVGTNFLDNNREIVEYYDETDAGYFEFPESIAKFVVDLRWKYSNLFFEEEYFYKTIYRGDDLYLTKQLGRELPGNWIVSQNNWYNENPAYYYSFKTDFGDFLIKEESEFDYDIIMDKYESISKDKTKRVKRNLPKKKKKRRKKKKKKDEDEDYVPDW